jgi:peroxiredoxin Q/BCP
MEETASRDGRPEGKPSATDDALDVEWTTPPDFELPNVGVGPDPLSLTEVAAASDFAVLVFFRDYHCPKCQEQASNIAAQAAELNSRNVAVVGVLPESKSKTAEWTEKLDLPFPVLADAGSDVADRYGQSVRFGPVGDAVDLIGRMPRTLILDLRDEWEVVYAHDGDLPTDRPSTEDLLGVVDEFRESFVFDCELVDC